MMSPVPAPVGSLVQRPCSPSQLLGIAAEERDPGVIEEAAIRQSRLVRAYQLTREPECTRQLDAIAQAMIVLLDRARQTEPGRGPGKPPAPAAAGAWPAWEGPTALQEVVLVPVRDDRKAGRSCDVELVCRDCS
jgi:hypothetical protein